MVLRTETVIIITFSATHKLPLQIEIFYRRYINLAQIVKKLVVPSSLNIR